jgi:hypothetical protein
MSKDHQDLEGPTTMRNVSSLFYSLHQLASTLLKLSADAGQFLLLCLRPSPALAAIASSFCANNSPYMETIRSNPEELPMRLGWHWFGSPVGLTGDPFCAS